MKNLTLQALRGLVGSTKGLRLPTARALRESGNEIVANTIIGTNTQLIVYQNGFYIYQTEIGATVYGVDRCVGYAYDGGEVLDMALFEDGDWAVRLLLAGEDRLEHNNNIREQGNHFSYSADTTERGDLRDPRDFVADIESREAVEEMLGCLTEKQQEAVRMRFIESMTQVEIQRTLGLARGALLDRLKGAMKKLRENFR